MMRFLRRWMPLRYWLVVALILAWELIDHVRFDAPFGPMWPIIIVGFFGYFSRDEKAA